MKKKFFVRILIMGLFLLFPIALTSCEFIPGEPSKVLPKEDFEISPYFCDGMVLQQKEMVTIKGKTEASVTMKVSLYRNEFEYKSITNIANDKGDFILSFEAPKASKDVYRMEINDGVHKKVFKNVHFGDVYVVCGEGYLSSPTYEKDKDSFTISSYTAFYQNGEWITENKENNVISEFVFKFARKLADKENLPIGVVVAVADSAHIDSWLSPKLIADNKRVNDFLTSEHRLLELSNGYYEDYDTMSSLYLQVLEIASEFNAKALIWNQGETNFDNKKFTSEEDIEKYASEYQYVLLKLIEQFYEQFNNSNILILQSASSDKTYMPYLRNLQAISSYYYNYVNLITTYDLNEMITKDVSAESLEEKEIEEEPDKNDYILGDVSIDKVISRVVKVLHATIYKKINGYLPPSYINSIYDTEYIHLAFSNAANLISQGNNAIVVKDIDGNIIDTNVYFDGNWILIELPKDIIDEETNEVIKAPIIKEISYGQDADITYNIIVNEQGIPIVPFRINVTNYQ